jgi:putative methanogen marker protein 4
VDVYKKIILENGRKTPKKIAIGLNSMKGVRAIEQAEDFHNVVIVTPRDLGKENQIITDNPEFKLIQLLRSGEVEGVVRGELSARKFKDAIKKLLKEENPQRTSLIKIRDSTFYLSPVGIDEGKNIDEKLEIAEKTAKILVDFGLNPYVGILSAGRLEDVGRTEVVDQSIFDGKSLESILRNRGFEVKHFGILIEEAVKECNILIAPDGIVGNYLFRIMVLVGSGEGFGAPYLIPWVVVDTSRASPYYSNAIFHAAALASLDKENQ